MYCNLLIVCSPVSVWDVVPQPALCPAGQQLQRIPLLVWLFYGDWKLGPRPFQLHHGENSQHVHGMDICFISSCIVVWVSSYCRVHTLLFYILLNAPIGVFVLVCKPNLPKWKTYLNNAWTGFYYLIYKSVILAFLIYFIFLSRVYSFHLQFQPGQAVIYLLHFA